MFLSLSVLNMYCKCTLQMGQRVKPKVILGPGHLAFMIALQLGNVN